MTTCVYVANAQSQDIAVLALDTASGALTEVQRLATGGAVMPLAVRPDRRRLYASLRSEPYQVVSLAIDPLDGRLEEIGRAPLPASLCGLSSDRSGRFLLGASYGSDLVCVCPLDADGRAGAAQQVVPTEPKAHAIHVDAANRYAYAACLGGDRIRQFRFDASTGRLSDPEPTAWLGRPGAGPRHLAFHPAGAWLYVLNELDASIDVLGVDAARGRLDTQQTVSAWPPGCDASPPWAADIHLTPDGRFLYASERRSSTLAAFAVDRVTGRLAELGWTATEAQPRGFAISPDGGFLFAAGQLSHRLATYAIDRASGGLRALGSQPVGEDPNWVEVVEL